MKNNKKRIRIIKRRGKINLIMIAICLITISLISQKCLAQEQIKVKEITVNKYDTLWNIADEICNNNENLTIQNVIIEIKKMNNLSTSDIYVGQHLTIPVY